MTLRLTLVALGALLVSGCGSNTGDDASKQNDAGLGGAIGSGGSGKDASAGTAGFGGIAGADGGGTDGGGTSAGGTSAGGTNAGGMGTGGTSAGGSAGASTGGMGGVAGAGATTGSSCTTPPTSLSPRWIFFEGGLALNAVDVATGSPAAPILVSDGLMRARFSPDGQSFAYTNASAEFFAVSVGTTLGAPQPIATSVYGTPGWSPNSEWLTYIRDVGAINELYAARRVGSSFQAPQKVNGALPASGDITMHVWSPSSKLLAFNVDTGAAPVFVSDFGSGAPGTPLQVTGGAPGNYWDTTRIAWSPASDSIAHGIEKFTTDHALDLVNMGLGSPSTTPVVTKSCESIRFEWASLPGRFAFTKRDPASCSMTALYVVTTTGGSPVKVADYVHDFHFSPDGTWLAYLQSSPQSVSLVPLTAAGPGAVQLVSPGATTQYAWSPTGKHIAFNSTVQNRKHLFLASVNATTTSAAIQITPSTPNIDVESVDSTNLDPLLAWSPDGKHLLFRSRRFYPGTFVYLADLFYADITQTPAAPVQINSLPVEGSDVLSMAWAASSKYFVYHADHQQKGLHQLYFVALDGATPCAPLVLSGGKPVYKSSSRNYWLAPS